MEPKDPQQTEASIALESVITCPVCGHRKREVMPENACQWFYQCERCESRLTPLPGDCCVFCSYGDTPCPPVQANPKGTCHGC